MEIHGVIPPMVTPVTGQEGGVNEPVLRQYTEFLLDEGVHGVFPCGSIGEFPSLSPADRDRVVQIVADVAHDVPVLAGCGATSLSSVRRHICAAADAGADIAVVVTPYYLDVTQHGLIQFYERLAEESPLPVMLYNIPQRTGVALAVETVSELAAQENIIGIKDSSGSISYHYRVLSESPEDFVVIQGLSMLAVTALDAGAVGVISGAANLFPGALADMYDAYQAGDRERAVRIVNSVASPVVSAYADLPTASAVKFLVREAGFDVGPPVLPLTDLTDEQQDYLASRYQQVKDHLAAVS